MELQIVKFCPLNENNKCESIRDNKIYRCEWYETLPGVNLQTGEVSNETRCSLRWIPVLLVENAGTNRGQTAALESFRNAVVLRKLEHGN